MQEDGCVPSSAGVAIRAVRRHPAKYGCRAQFRETLTQQRYSPVAVHNYCRNAYHFLRYLAEREIAVRSG